MKRKRHPKVEQETCPECGRLGEVRNYTDGDKLYIHQTRKGLFGLTEITDSCYIGIVKKRGENK
jgi:hypothetical protein